MDRSIVFLCLAILSELIGTSALKTTAGFERIGPWFTVIIGYSLALVFLALSLRAIPLGVAYAVWSGVGTAGIAIVGWLVFKEDLSALASWGWPSPSAGS
jgi:small multidrug resistance pump